MDALDAAMIAKAPIVVFVMGGCPLLVTASWRPAPADARRNHPLVNTAAHHSRVELILSRDTAGVPKSLRRVTGLDPWLSATTSASKTTVSVRAPNLVVSVTVRYPEEVTVP
jgi:hypothetical protein